MLEYIRSWFMVRKGEKGQDLAEYALLIGLIALVVLLAVTFLGTQIDAVFSAIGNNISTWAIGS
jgi:pilus assembly protein Flp/PilA